MMESLAFVAILVAIGLTFWSPLRRMQTALGLDHLISTGHAFLVLGFLLALALGARPAAILDEIGPIVSFFAGWVGLSVGMRFDLRVLRTLPLRAYRVALLPPLLAALGVGGAGLLVLFAWRVPSRQAWAAAFVLAAAAATSGPTLVAMLRRRRAGRSSDMRPVLRLIEFSAGIDDLVLMLLAGIGFAMFRPTVESIAPGWWLAVTLGGGALLGVVTWLFLGGSAKSDERLLLGLAMLAFIAGFAGWLHLSPVAVAAISGVVIANLPGDRVAQLEQVVRRVERPAVVILMTAIGFDTVGTITLAFLPLVFVMTVLRLLAKQLGGWLTRDTLQDLPGLSPRRGWASGLASQGTLGLVVALSYFHIWRDDTARSVLAAVAAASVINELAAPWLLLRLVRRTTGGSRGLTAERAT